MKTQTLSGKNKEMKNDTHDTPPQVSSYISTNLKALLFWNVEPLHF